MADFLEEGEKTMCVSFTNKTANKFNEFMLRRIQNRGRIRFLEPEPNLDFWYNQILDDLNYKPDDNIPTIDLFGRTFITAEDDRL